MIFQSWDSYSLSHVKNHHPKLGSEFDPDFAYYKQSGIFEINSKSKFFWKFFFSRLFCLNIFQSLKYLIFNRLMVCSNKNELIKIMLVHLVFFTIGTFLIGYKFYFLYWLLPYLTTFQVVTWFIELAEHYPMISYAKNNLYASRNRFSHVVEHFFTGMHGENYHLIHHLFPAIPFWNLSKAHKI